ncbi:MAG: hypothetical protein QOH00_1911, partial [Gaiellales bacterium]|nr:hypothetical protein [Gaiellales bacterium]
MKTTVREVRSIKSHRPGLALLLAAFFATLSIALSPAAALANGGRHHHGADVTFTKWLISLPADPTTNA